LRGCLVVWSVVHIEDRSDVTLAFEDAQVIHPFSREKTYKTDDIDNHDDTDDTEECRNVGM
jgi:hypothetical protein